MRTPASKVEHLYVHVPFCAAKCNYCAFYSEAGGAAKMGDYVEAVLKELEQYRCRPLLRSGEDCADSQSRPTASLHLVPTTIFFGGGTPSILPAPLMRHLLEAVGRACSPSAPREWTIECNPSTVSTEKAKLFREFGVNRISMGVQALDDDLLKTIGRVHSVKAAITSYEKLRKAGFENINLDLMFGLPGQTIGHLRNTLERVIELQPEHVSIYCLILEEDTHFWRLYSGAGILPASYDSRTGILPVNSARSASILLAESESKDPSRQARCLSHEPSNTDGQARCLSYDLLPNDDKQLAMYKLAIETLEAAGYRQYEVSNFAKPGRECAHNIAYWKVEDYLGLGPSACSTVGDRRWQNVADIKKYVEGVRRQETVVSYEERLTPELRAAERAAFGMRMNDGVPADLVRGRWDKQIAELLGAELVQWCNGRLTPTKRGILFADAVAAEFL
jgi:oxygen-independent coproporphyrinogen-3 oxidase